MRHMLLLCLLGLLIGCGGTPAQPTPPDFNEQAIQSLPAALADIQTQSSVSVVAPVWLETDQAALVVQLSVLQQPQVLFEAQQVLLNTQPAHDQLLQANQQTYAIVRATGTLSTTTPHPTLDVDEIKLIEPITVTLEELLDNPSTYQDQVVSFVGTLIVSENEALLVEEITEGGVPAADARQLKISQPFGDPQLRVIGNSAVGVVQVNVVGLLQGKSVRIFWVAAN